MKRVIIIFCLLIFSFSTYGFKETSNNFKYQYTPDENMTISTSSKGLVKSLSLKPTNNLKAFSKKLDVFKIYSAKMKGKVSIRYNKIKTIGKSLSQMKFLNAKFNLNNNLTKLNFKEINTFKKSLSDFQIYNQDNISKSQLPFSLNFKKIRTKIKLLEYKNIFNADYQKIHSLLSLDKSKLLKK